MNCLGFGVSVFGFRDWSLGFRVEARFRLRGSGFTQRAHFQGWSLMVFTWFRCLCVLR